MSLNNVLGKRNQILLRELIATDFKLRYQGSALGYVWSILRPLLLFGILYVIFVLVIKSGDNIPYFPVYLLLGIVIWTFFTDMTQQSLGSIVARGDLIRKISIPRWIIVFSTTVLAVINLGLNMVVVAIAIVLNGVPLEFTALLLIPLFIELYLFGLGLSLLLSAAFVRYRDIGYIWEVVLQIGFYATPILYAMSFVPASLQRIQLLNPIAQVMQDARLVLVTDHEKVVTIWRAFDNGWYSLIPIAVVLITLGLGIVYFRSQSRYFAENI